METATEQVEHKVDHGKVKTEEVIDIIAYVNSRTVS